MESQKKVKLDMLQSTAIVLFSAIVCASSAPLTSCSAAVDYFSTVIDTTLLWQSPSLAPDGTCSLPATCCSSSAIAALKAVVSNKHRSQVSTLIAAAKGSCFSEQVETTITRFLTAEKASMKEKARLYLGDYYTSELGLIFDRFVGSAGDFIVGSKPLCGLENLIPELAFSVFWPFLTQLHPELRTANTSYQECTKEFVNDHYATSLNEARRSFEQPLLRVAHLFKYRNSMLNALSGLESEELSLTCLADLVATQYCEGCSGMRSEASAPCLSQCKFAMEACLKPFQALSDAINDWTLYASDLRDAIATFNPDYMFSSVPWKVLDIAADLTIPGTTVMTQLDARCASTSRRKRTALDQGLAMKPTDSPTIRRKRQSVVSLNSAAQREIDCLTALVTPLSHEAVTTALCENATSVAPCDDSATVSRNLSLQLSDPLKRAVGDLNWQRKYILAVLFRCEEAQHGVCPDVWNYCWEQPLPPTPTVTTSSTSRTTVQSPTSSPAASSNPQPASTPSPAATPAPSTKPQQCPNTGEERPDQETGDNGVGSAGGCLPTTTTSTASLSPQPTVPQTAQGTGGGAGIQDSCSCLTVLVMLLSAVLIWSY